MTEVRQDIDGLFGVSGVEMPGLGFRGMFDDNYLPFWLGGCMAAFGVSSSVYISASHEGFLVPAVLLGVFSSALGFIFAGFAQPFHAKYDPQSKSIIFNDKHEKRLHALLGHEYSHHVLHEVAGVQENELALNEGLSSYAEMYASQQKAARTGDPSYAFFGLKEGVDRLKGASKFISRYLEHPEKSWLDGRRAVLDGSARIQAFHLSPRAQMDVYNVGYALVRVAEERFGPDIFREVVKRDFGNLMV